MQAASHDAHARKSRAPPPPPQVALIRESLASVHEKEESWSDAARVLSGIDLDSGQRQLDGRYKLEKCVKIAQLFLEDDDALSAEAFIKKATPLLSGSKDEALELQFKTCYARIQDAKRRFLDAAWRYYELSQQDTSRDIGGLRLSEDDLTQALSAAVTCTILAGAGPQRSRVLATLFKDERCVNLPEYTMLKKVYLERILKPEEVRRI